jgi:PadR family transcriptional regulator
LAAKASVGEFEEMVLLAMIRLGKQGGLATEIAHELENRANRYVSIGALYTTLDRLEKKHFLTWQIEAHTPELKGSRKRRFRVTPQGVAAVSARRDALLSLWDGIEGTLRSQS